MNIITILKNFFYKTFKGEVNQPSTDIVVYKSLIKIPNKKIFKYNKEVLSKIKKYKKKYYEILNTDATLVSKNLSFGDFYDELRTNSNLILNIIIKHEDNSQFFFNEENEIDKKLKKELNKLKLNLYEKRIDEMELETIIRGIALQEVYYERLLFLKKDKINAINKELSILTISLNNFYYQKESLKREKQTYQTELETSEIKEKISFNELEARAKIKYEYLLNNVNFIPNVTDKLNEREESYLSKLAYLERKIEIYIYENKELLEQIDAKLEQYLDFQNITKDKKDQLLNEIKYFEQVCKIICEYGRNILIREILYKLYRFKFELLTFDILNQKQSPFLFTNDLEFQIYEEIVMNKISNLLNPKNKITQKLFGDDIKKALKIIISILKKGNINSSIYEPNKILINIDKLCLLLSFDTFDGLQELYNRRTINFTHYISNTGIKLFNNIFSWEEYVPLETIYRWRILDSVQEYIEKRWLISEPQYIQEHLLPTKEYIDQTKTLFILYTYFDKHRTIDRNTYYIPEGIVEIKLESEKNMEELQKSDIIQKDLEKYNKGIKIICPSGLKSWKGCFFGNKLYVDHWAKEIVLNGGLKVLGDNAVGAAYNSSVSIPSSVQEIYSGLFLVNVLKTITFKDFINSSLLHDKRKLNLFLSKFIEVDLIEQKSLSLKDYLKQHQKEIFSDIDLFVEYNVADFAKHQKYCYEYRFKYSIALENIIFDIDSHNCINIFKDDLIIEDSIYSANSSKDKVLQLVQSSELPINMIIDRIANLIYEKTGHILFDEEPVKEKNQSHHSCKL